MAGIPGSEAGFLEFSDAAAGILDAVIESGALAREEQMAAARSWQAGTGPGAGGLAAWAERSGRRRAEETGRGGLRFAFYGRVSTEDWQDPESSLARQLTVSSLTRRRRTWCRGSSPSASPGTRWRGSRGR